MDSLITAHPFYLKPMILRERKQVSVEHKESEMDGHKKYQKPTLSKRQPCSSQGGAWFF